MSNLPPCDSKIYKTGIPIACVANMSGRMGAEDIEKVVKKAAKISGQKIDWHYVGGRGNVLCLGDISAAKEALRSMELGNDILVCPP